MVKGVLCINLNPAYVSFTPDDGESTWRRDCSADEALAILCEVGSISSSERFSPKEFTVRMPIEISPKSLWRFGLGTEVKELRRNKEKVVAIEDRFCATVLDGNCYEECSCFDLYQIDNEIQQEAL